jgi:hypothetical protein
LAITGFCPGLLAPCDRCFEVDDGEESEDERLIGPIKMPENSFQTTSTIGMGAISFAGTRSTARRRSTPPAKMLPKSRKASVNGLISSSMMLSTTMPRNGFR